MSQSIKSIEAENITVFFKPDVCEHARKCIRGLSSVFNEKNSLVYHQKMQPLKKL